ncbi:MAG: Holliday junction branch migration protein RuvA [Saccharofermentans sp.]|nr:Holliday junction branch migration protein RuvA [Saccharofermentans sp.]
MYSYIKGELVKRTDDYVVVDNNGIGYEILCPAALSLNLGDVGSQVTCWIYQSVREDDISLYGFASPEEKDMFLLLITVSGIGPKVAHSICSQMDPGTLAMTVINGDVKALTSVKGLGKKGAERIILEISDKLKKSGAAASSTVSKLTVPSGGRVIVNNDAADAVEALMVLGYKEADAQEAVNSVYEDGIDLQELIRRSLRALAK